MQTRTVLVTLLALFPFACNGFAGDRTPVVKQQAPPLRRTIAREEASQPPKLGPKQAGVPRIVFLGDSVTHGQGLASTELAFPELIEEHLRLKGTAIEAVNAGVPGDTTAMGAKRLPELLALQPDVLVVALGGNDAAHGQPASEAREHLSIIIREAQHAGVKVLLAGLRVPQYVAPTETSRDFERMYLELAQQLRVTFVPNFMEGCFGEPGMLQQDGVHPTAAGQRRVAETVEPFLVQVLKETKV